MKLIEGFSIRMIIDPVMCLKREAGTTTYIKNLKNLMLEVFRTLSSLNLPYVWDFFTTRKVE